MVSLGVSAFVLAAGLVFVDALTPRLVLARLLWPLARLMLFIGLGLVVGQVIEVMGWTRILALLASPLFRFARMAPQCSAAFSAAFFSGVTANAMLIDFYKEGSITKEELYLSVLINQVPAYFLHLPTTVFIVLPLTGWAGAFYFLITFAALVLRTVCLLVYGRLRRLGRSRTEPGQVAPSSDRRADTRSLRRSIARKFPPRLIKIAVYVVPVYIIIFIANVMGCFSLAQKWLAGFMTTTFMPVESLSLVVLSFAAEFTSGFAAAGALLHAGVLSVKQTALALLAGNVVAFPIRALRHQLPHYMGIFEPKMGTQLLLMGQGLRILSLLVAGAVYFLVG